MSGPILIMAGGTGGHVFPALAVAEELRQRQEEVVWLGTRRGIEADIVPRAGIELEWTRISGLRGKGIFSWILAPLKLLVALLDACIILIRRRPKVVLGMGGFASGPGGFAAWLLRTPLVIHEQNSVAGLTNRVLARCAGEVLEAFPGSFPDSRETRLVGNPVRPEIFALPEPRQRLATHHGLLRVLVLGGSLGAQVLNEVIPQALALLAQEKRPAVWHQTGARTFQFAQKAYADAEVSGRLEAFIEDMADAYNWADLVICRAGALTVAELAAAGLAAILVPYPHAVDDHQTRNADYLAAAGAAVVKPQAELTPEWLAEELAKYVDDRTVLINQAIAARTLAHPNATRDVVECCLEMARAA
jgi:UDP-N-acetylglucosamine--N-acetylmuramyl-(pentapeptide) pyrophosphoryl-undecaprenol N-acetylglucosamine transferase